MHTTDTNHLTPIQIGSKRKQKTIALVGHPNVGKSVIFHALTGKYVTVSNYPGTTVDLSRGLCRTADQDWLVFDTPGVLSLQPHTDDEKVTRDLLLETHPDVIIQVADSKNLSKSLHLTLELSEFGHPLVLALNMADESQDRGLQINIERLSLLLGIPVIETVAITGEGISDLKAALLKATPLKVKPRYDAQLLNTLHEIEEHLLPDPESLRAISVSLFNNDKSAWPHAIKRIRPGSLGNLEKSVERSHRTFVRPPEMLLFESKQSIIQEIIGETLSMGNQGKTKWLSKLGNWVMRPFPGYLVVAFTLYLLYEFVGVFGAGTLVEFFEERLFGNLINPFFTKIINSMVPFSIVQEALIGPYGLITMALTYAFALILPIVTTFFLFFGFLEDSGYLPRLAVMMDRFFRIMGLNGRAILPVVLGLGCDTMATVTTRILDTRKEKLIISMLLTLAVPCSAQLGAILGMAAGVSWKILVAWFLIISSTFLFTGWATSKVLPGSRAPFLVELPPLRIPKFSNLYKKVKVRLKWYIKEVIPLFVLATFVLFILDKLALLKKLERLFSPVVVSFLGLPENASQAFLIGFFRRDYGAAGFFQMSQDKLLSPHQVLVSMVVITLFMPCVAHLLMTIKERGWKPSFIISVFVFSYALLVGGAVHWFLSWTALL